MELNKYFLVKVFETAEYREQFNNGDIYLKNTSYYWNLENAFQQDKEGSIFEQEGRGYLVRANGDFHQILAKASSLDDILKYMNIENAGEILAETKNFALRVEGYLCCFYLLPKSAVSFTQSTLSITSEQERKDISEFLNRYLSESPLHSSYVSIYDAVAFCSILFKEMTDKGYKITYGQVKYEDIDKMTKIEKYQRGDVKSILFIKPTKYSYQKEFRILLTKPNEPIKEHVSESGIEIKESSLGSFDYVNLISTSNSKKKLTED